MKFLRRIAQTPWAARILHFSLAAGLLSGTMRVVLLICAIWSDAPAGMSFRWFPPAFIVFGTGLVLAAATGFVERRLLRRG